MLVTFVISRLTIFWSNKMATHNKQNETVDQTISQFIDAGLGLATLPFHLLQRSLSTTKENTINEFSSLQVHGALVEKRLKETLTSFNFCSTIKSRFSSQSSKDVKLTQLSLKIDSLAESVAKIAAKQAAETTPKTPPKPTPAAPRKRATRSASGTKPRTTSTKSTTSTTKKDV